MFDIVIENLKKVFSSRLLPIGLLFITFIAILINRIFVLQIVNGQRYIEQQIIKVEKHRELKSTRGSIYDVNGKLLAFNELSYTVVLEDTGLYKTNDEKNAMIHRIIGIIEDNAGTIVNDFNIDLDQSGELKFNVEGNSLLRFKREVYSLSNSQNLSEKQMAATAEDVFEYLRFGSSKHTPMFNISSEYTIEEAIKIMAIRYSIYMNRFKMYLPITVATDVNDRTVAIIKENSDELLGADVLQETHRVYNNSIYFSHILGYTGLVSAEDLDSNSDDKFKYSATDQIGKSGIEKEYESYLRGQKGDQTLMVNESGKIMEVKKVIDSIAGNDIYLTIDKELTIAAYKILERKIAGILVSNIVNSTSSGSKGVSSDKILIPIYDVYFALINNNIININTFTNVDATNLEKSVHKKFTLKQKEVIDNLIDLMALDSKTIKKGIADEMSEYLDYTYSALISNSILLKDEINSDDEKVIDYKNDKISLSEFLQYAISKNWLDLSKLQIDDKYYSTDEIYSKLLTYARGMLENDGNFNKRLYHYLVYSYKLTGTEISLLLFDQGVLKYDKTQIEKLQNGTLSAYSFMINKIKKLEITPAQLALEPCSGSIVITDVNSGEVRALVSYPSYDNNKFANRIDPAYYGQLLNDKSTPLNNRPTQQRTAPGSTFKMLTAITGLEEEIIGTTETIKDLGVFDKTSPPARCWIYPHGTHGSINVSHALEVSCNYFFYELGYRLSLDSTSKYVSQLGLDKFRKYADILGLSAKSGIELPEAEPQVSTTSSIRSSIGQGNNNFTPVQLSRYVTTIANSGTAYDLTIIDKIKDIEGNTIVDNKATVYNKVGIKDSTWDLVHEGMNLVVNGEKSSIKKFFNELNITVAGKSGTAQESKSKPNHALFVGYAPFEKPEISVTAVIPHGYTSANTAELVRDVMKYYFKLDSSGDLITGEVIAPDSSGGSITD